jgi:hypothetical protein
VAWLPLPGRPRLGLSPAPRRAHGSRWETGDGEVPDPAGRGGLGGGTGALNLCAPGVGEQSRGHTREDSKGQTGEGRWGATAAGLGLEISRGERGVQW